MSDDIEVVYGSGNVFRDLGTPNADIEQAKAILAAQIIGILKDKELSVRLAHEMTGFAAADFSRVRNADLDRFTVDRLMKMVESLDSGLEITLSVHPRAALSDSRATS